MSDEIDQLESVLRERQERPSPESYTTRLLMAGEDEIVKKIGEEAIEVILAAKSQGDGRVVEETADLIYHVLVLLVSRGLSWEDIRRELAQRRR